MRAVLLDSDGVVQNVIEYDPNGDYEPPEGLVLQANADAPIGSRWDGSVFTPPVQEPKIMPPADETLNAMMFVARSRVAEQIQATTFKAADAPKVVALFPQWAVGLAVKVGDIYAYNNKIVQCVQAHTTQADWTPDVTPALWTIYRDPAAISEWVQPTGSQDAYALGAKVTHNGKTWSSNVNANVWEPPTQWTEVV